MLGKIVPGKHHQRCKVTVQAEARRFLQQKCSCGHQRSNLSQAAGKAITSSERSERTTEKSSSFISSPPMPELSSPSSCLEFSAFSQLKAVREVSEPARVRELFVLPLGLGTV